MRVRVRIIVDKSRQLADHTFELTGEEGPGWAPLVIVNDSKARSGPGVVETGLGRIETIVELLP
jgi:hypothetical protein